MKVRREVIRQLQFRTGAGVHKLTKRKQEREFKKWQH